MPPLQGFLLSVHFFPHAHPGQPIALTLHFRTSAAASMPGRWCDSISIERKLLWEQALSPPALCRWLSGLATSGLPQSTRHPVLSDAIGVGEDGVEYGASWCMR